MARTKNEETILDSKTIVESKTEVKEKAMDNLLPENAEVKKEPDIDVFTLEKELVATAIKSACALKINGIPMNSQQIATLETLRNLYESLKK